MCGIYNCGIHNAAGEFGQSPMEPEQQQLMHVEGYGSTARCNSSSHRLPLQDVRQQFTTPIERKRFAGAKSIAGGSSSVCGIYNGGIHQCHCRRGFGQSPMEPERQQLMHQVRLRDLGTATVVYTIYHFRMFDSGLPHQSQ
jgi:hypothetical protein